MHDKLIVLTKPNVIVHVIVRTGEPCEIQSTHVEELYERPISARQRRINADKLHREQQDALMNEARAYLDQIDAERKQKEVDREALVLAQQMKVSIVIEGPRKKWARKTSIKVIRPNVVLIARPSTDQVDVWLILIRIKAHRKTDMRDNRLPVCDLTLEFVKGLLMGCLMCPVCDEEILLKSGIRCRFLWSIDRLDNSKGHTQDNVRITCMSCNISDWQCDPDVNVARATKHGRDCLHGCHKAPATQ